MSPKTVNIRITRHGHLNAGAWVRVAALTPLDGPHKSPLFVCFYSQSKTLKGFNGTEQEPILDYQQEYVRFSYIYSQYNDSTC